MGNKTKVREIGSLTLLLTRRKERPAHRLAAALGPTSHRGDCACRYPKVGQSGVYPGKNRSQIGSYTTIRIGQSYEAETQSHRPAWIARYKDQCTNPTDLREAKAAAMVMAKVQAETMW